MPEARHPGRNPSSPFNNQGRSPVKPLKILSALVVSAAAFTLAPHAPAFAVEQQKADLVNRTKLRVCSDPADLPFSNEKAEGFENKIADILADELKIPVEYTWFPKSQGFIRQTLSAKRCDVVIGWGQGDELVLNTNAIYRSTSAIIYKKGGPLDGVTSLADEKLKGKTIGAVQNSAGANLAAKYGLMANVHGYPLNVDRRYFNPTEEMIKDLKAGTIEFGVQWGPIAAYWAKKLGGDDVVVVPITKDTAGVKTAFRITLGVRPGDDAWKRQLNQIIAKRQPDIDKVLLDYGIPVLVDDDTSMELVTSPRPASTAQAEAPPAAPDPEKAARPYVPVPNQ